MKSIAGPFQTLLSLSKSLISFNKRHLTMDIFPIPALKDNYMYLVVNRQNNHAIAIDPVDPKAVLNKVKQLNTKLQFVLTTHHHWDHSSGNDLLKQQSGLPLKIYGGDDRVQGLTDKVKSEDIISFGDIQIRCLFTPCHTTGHMCYYIDDGQGQRVVFTGDTLFVAGCGRFFEGTASHMLAALDLLQQLPPDTKVFCGHEYTLTNLKFALSVEPQNPDIIEKLKSVRDKRSMDEMTIPSTIEEEMKTNPFMRVRQKSIQDAVKSSEPAEVMKKLRDLKDNFTC